MLFSNTKIFIIHTLTTLCMRLYHTSAAVLEKLCLSTLKIELDLADLLRAGGYRLDALRAAEPVELPLHLHDRRRGVRLLGPVSLGW